MDKFELFNENKGLGVSVKFPEDISFKQFEDCQTKMSEIIDQAKTRTTALTMRAAIEGFASVKPDWVLEGMELKDYTRKQGVWLANLIGQYLIYLETNDPN